MNKVLIVSTSMAYDAALAERITQLLAAHKAVEQKRMFGGVCFLLRGHMCCGVAGNKLMVRVGPDRYEALLQKPHVKPMDFTGRPLRGFVFVTPQGLRTRAALKAWLNLGVRYAASLPPKRKPKPAGYFWTKEWQAGEREAEQDIRKGRVKKFKKANELMKELRRGK